MSMRTFITIRGKFLEDVSAHVHTAKNKFLVLTV